MACSFLSTSCMEVLYAYTMSFFVLVSTLRTLRPACSRSSVVF